MAPREMEDKISVAASASAEVGSSGSSLKVVDFALEIPLVSDAVTAASSLAGPYVDTVGPYIMEHCSPVVRSIGSKAEDLLSDSMKEKVGSMVETLDKIACSSLANLTEQMPSLASPTPELIEDAKDSVTSYLALASEYMASFKVSQLSLRVGDRGLQMLESAMKSVGANNGFITKLRRGTRAVRRAGARRAGPIKGLSEASMAGAVAEILGLNFFLSILGLEVVPAQKTKPARKKVISKKIPYSPSQKFGDLHFHDDSDLDGDYSPSEASDDSLEYDSGREKVVYEDEHAQVLVEDTGDEEEKEIIAEDFDGDQDRENENSTKKCGDLDEFNEEVEDSTEAEVDEAEEAKK